MGLLFAFITNDSHRLRCSLHPHRHDLLVPQETTGDGWGLGFYHGDEVLLKKRPQRSEGDLDVYALAQGIRTEVLVGHVREATIGGGATENTQPFRFRRWMGAHVGTVDGFNEISDDLLASIPDFLRRNIRGQTDSEIVFHLFLAFLHDGGKLEDPRIEPATAADALRATIAFVDKAVAGRKTGQDQRASTFNATFTNGHILLASRRNLPLSIARRSGIADCPICSAESEALGRAQTVAHEHLQGALLLSRPNCPEGNGWEAIPNESLVLIDHDISIRVAPLRVQ